MNDITNLDKFLPEERAEIAALFLGWQRARANKEWALADEYRKQFAWWDETLGTDGIWYPVFEYALNRQRRAFKRMQKYNIDVYPWDRGWLP